MSLLRRGLFDIDTIFLLQPLNLRATFSLRLCFVPVNVGCDYASLTQLCRRLKIHPESFNAFIEK